MSDISFSIVVATKGRVKLLTELIESIDVTRQNYDGECEVLIVDDSNPEESKQVQAVCEAHDCIYVYYENMDFADYTNPRTGVRQLKAQHPEYETYMGPGSVHASMFTCADCHMERAKNAAGQTYRSHTWVSPLQSESIRNTCAACHQDLTGFVQGIQEKMEARTIAIGNRLEELTNKLADAVASGEYTEEELNAIRALNRKGQWYWDFVFVENSEGAHNSRLDNNCLDKAEAFINAALKQFDV